MTTAARARLPRAIRRRSRDRELLAAVLRAERSAPGAVRQALTDDGDDDGALRLTLLG